MNATVHAWLPRAACLLALLIFPVFVRSEYVLDIASQIAIFVLLGCGLNVVVGLAGLLDLGYIAFCAVGAYAVACLASDQFGIHLGFWCLLPLAALTAAAFAIVIGLPTLRLRGDYLSIVTLGFGEVVRIALLNGGWVTNGPDGIQNLDPITLFGYRFTYQMTPYYYLIVGFAVVGIAIGEGLRRSRWGLVWRALRDDETAARAAGISPLRYYLLAFAIGAAYAGVAGALFAAKQLTVSPDSFTIDQSIFVLAVVVMGGMNGRFLPLVLSAIVIVGLPEALRGLGNYRMIIFGPLLVAVTIIRVRWREIVTYMEARRASYGTPAFKITPTVEEDSQ